MAIETTPSQEIRKTASVHTLTSFDEMDRLFDSLLRRSWLRPLRFDWPTNDIALPFNGNLPKVDVIDRENDIVIRAETPGVEKKDLDITIGEDNVTIKGTIRREEENEKGDYYRHELSEGSFSRTVGLPASVDSPRARANFKDGILELVLPKIEKAKRHSVKIE